MPHRASNNKVRVAPANRLLGFVSFDDFLQIRFQNFGPMGCSKSKSPWDSPAIGEYLKNGCFGNQANLFSKSKAKKKHLDLLADM